MRLTSLKLRALFFLLSPPKLFVPFSVSMQSFQFHPAVARWFEQTFGSPTEPQMRGWPAIQSGRHVLISAPTGSGKTLAAFLASLDALFREGSKIELPDRNASRLRLAAQSVEQRYPQKSPRTACRNSRVTAARQMAARSMFAPKFAPAIRLLLNARR